MAGWMSCFHFIINMTNMRDYGRTFLWRSDLLTYGFTVCFTYHVYMLYNRCKGSWFFFQRINELLVCIPLQIINPSLKIIKYGLVHVCL